MPRIKKNYFVKGASGNMEKEFVYKQRGKRTFIAAMPTIDPNLQPTADQIKIRKTFKFASLYAQGAISDATLKKEYKKKAAPHQTAFNVAFMDYFSAPVVSKIGTGQYTGAVGSKVIVEAKDDFKVSEVHVAIFSGAGSVLEEGLAVLNPFNKNQWIYTTQMLNSTLPGTSIVATARDLPGNEGILDITLQ